MSRVSQRDFRAFEAWLSFLSRRGIILIVQLPGMSNRTVGGFDKLFEVGRIHEPRWKLSSLLGQEYV
jgi:hypothetical protein